MGISLYTTMLQTDWRYYVTTISLLCLLLPAFVISCTSIETASPTGPAKDNAAVSVDQTAPTLLDVRSFQAQPRTIKAGESTTLKWDVRGASSFSIEPGTGPVSGNTGSVSISPKETTLYTLKVSDGRLETTARFLVIVKTADGSIIWPNSGADNATTEQIYEGWSYYPNKYVAWKVTDRYNDPNGDTGSCWYVGNITNSSTKWMMTEVSINNMLILDGILPGMQSVYTVSIDCNQSPFLKWKWKVFR